MRREAGDNEGHAACFAEPSNCSSRASASDIHNKSGRSSKDDEPQFLAITCNPQVCTNISKASNSSHKLMFRHHRREITSKVFTAATSCPPKNCKTTKFPKWKQEKHRRQGCSASHRHHRGIQIRFARYHLLFTQRNCQETWHRGSGCGRTRQQSQVRCPCLRNTHCQWHCLKTLKFSYIIIRLTSSSVQSN